MTSPPTAPSGGDPEDSWNRRREQRLQFVADCEVDVKGPAWAMTMDPLSAQTMNLTPHGIRLMVPRFSRERFDKWDALLKRGDSIRVTIRLTNHREPVFLDGEIVWGAPEGPEDRGLGLYAFGVLLNVMKPEMAKRLRRIIEGISGDENEVE